MTVTKPEPYTAEGCTILLGNPALKLPHNAPTKTRFKMRQRLVGSAVEHAASLVMRDSAETPSEAGDFKKLFFDTEADDEETIYLGEFLDVLFEWQAELSGKKEFETSLLAEYINRDDRPLESSEPARTEKGRALREFLYPDKPANQKMTVGCARAVRQRHDGLEVPPRQPCQRDVLQGRKECRRRSIDLRICGCGPNTSAIIRISAKHIRSRHRLNVAKP